MIPVIMPMCDNRASANRAYDEASETIMQSLAAGYDVTFLCEGDPLFFGSFAYLLDRIAPHYRCDVVPGISSVHAATAVLQKPLTCLKDSFAVVSGRHSDEKIIETLRQHDSVVIMKAGRARARLLSLLEKAGRRQEAHYLAYIGRAQEQVVIDMDELDKTAEGPYFSLFFVLPKGRDSR